MEPILVIYVDQYRYYYGAIFGVFVEEYWVYYGDNIGFVIGIILVLLWG